MKMKNSYQYERIQAQESLIADTFQVRQQFALKKFTQFTIWHGGFYENNLVW